MYTAFLFGQAEGRDLWQSTLLPFHLVLQALMAGAAGMLLLAFAVPVEAAMVDLARQVLVGVLIVDLAVTLAGEFGMPHASEAAARAAHEISRGRYRSYFWGGSILLGHLLPPALLMIGNPLLDAVAGLAVVAGLYFYEYAFVMAPQDIPNS